MEKELTFEKAMKRPKDFDQKFQKHFRCSIFRIYSMF